MVEDLDIRHIPVMLAEVLEVLGRPGSKIVVDATVGGAGHAEALLETLKEAQLIGLDIDAQAVQRAARRLKKYGARARVTKAHFADMDAVLDAMDVGKVDAILMDLGVSSFHLDDPSRGFSFMKAGPLDMRMDRSREVTAERLVNTLSEKELATIFRKYGEEPYAFRFARAIVSRRKKGAITTTADLASVVAAAMPARAGRRGVHPATRVFQALRIAVNGELDRIGEAIEKAVDRLNPGGRIAVISFHSLEDRIVKTTLGALTRRCVCPRDFPMCVCGEPGKVALVLKRPRTPGNEELAANPRARSAKLRAAERLAA